MAVHVRRSLPACRGSRLTVGLAILAIGVGATGFVDAAAQQVPERPLREALTVGRVGCDIEFDGVGGILPWGREVLVLESTQVVRLTRDGQVVARIGREGLGPGEFRRTMAFGRRFDTLWVSDPMLRRLTLFSREGDLIRTVTLNSSFVGPEGYSLVMAYPQTDSTYIAMGSFRSFAIDAGLVKEQYRLVIDEQGLVIDTLDTLDIEPHDVAVIRRDPRGIGNPAFSQPIYDYPIATLSTDAGLAVSVHRRIKEAPDVYRLIVRDLVSGEVVSDTRHEVSPTRVPRGFFDEWMEKLDAVTNGMLPRSEVVPVLFRPELFPAAGRLEIGSDGVIWVSRQAYVGEEVVWDALTPDGTLRFRVTLPAGHVIRNSDAGGIWTSGHGDFDEQYVSYWEFIS